MSVNNICKSINCPFFSETKNYGCQLYTISEMCHLCTGRKLEGNQYALYSDAEVDLEALKRENEHFLLEEPHYKNTVDFQKEFPEIFAEDDFKAREIAG